MKKVIDLLIDIFVVYLLFILMSLGVYLICMAPAVGTLILITSAVLYFLNPWDRVTIKIKYFDQGIEKIQKISKGDWIDLRSAERVELKAGEYKLLRLGVGMILPDGYEALVLPRSSTPSKFGIMCANSQGVIDNSYSGDADEWKFPAVAIRDTVIEKGDRICQFRIVKNQPGIKFEVVDHLNEISRGGIGSTGKN